MNYGFSRCTVTFLTVVTICQMGSSLRKEGPYLGLWHHGKKPCSRSPRLSHIVYGKRKWGVRGKTRGVGVVGRPECWCSAGFGLSSHPSRMSQHELVLPAFKENLSEETFIDTLGDVSSQADREE